MNVKLLLIAMDIRFFIIIINNLKEVINAKDQ